MIRQKKKGIWDKAYSSLFRKNSFLKNFFNGTLPINLQGNLFRDA